MPGQGLRNIKDAWISVSETNLETLNHTLIEVAENGKILDKMKEKPACTMLSEEVDQIMMANGEFLCNARSYLRGRGYHWNPAIDRCRKRLELIK